MNKLFSLISFIIFCFFLNSCNSEKKQADFSRYINDYTHDLIKSKSSIVIVLEEPLTKNSQGSNLSDNILSCSPSISGALIQKDDHTLVFTPQSPLKNDKSYEFTLHLDKIYENVPEELKDFTFNVSVVPLTGHFINNGLSPNIDESSQKYQGTIVSTDYVPNEDVEKWVDVDMGSITLSTQWKHEGNIHTFVINDIKRGETDQTLKLSFAKHMNVRDLNIEIPSKYRLSVLTVSLSSTEENSILVYFSNSLDSKQNASSYIQIDNANVSDCKIDKNCIRINYKSPKANEILKLHILDGLKSVDGTTIKDEITYNIPIKNPNPEVKFIGNGTIMANEGKNIIPFSAIALEYVDITIKKVYNQNMVFHLQENNINENSWEFYRTAGTIIDQKRMDLRSKSIDLNQWNDFSIDLSNLVEMEKGVLYQVTLSFKRSYTTLYKDPEYVEGVEEPAYYTIENWWQNEDDPLSYAYYNESMKKTRNFINTSLGIIVKETNTGSYFISVNDLQTTKAVSNCQIILYDYQNQRIDSTETNNDGFAIINHKTNDGFVVKAQKGNDKAWLKLQNPLSLSYFNVSGESISNGLKGFIYGERGVWRPGDEMYISFILNDQSNPLPQGHPIVATLYNPSGTAIATRKSAVSTSPIHAFKFKTDENAITGFWNVKIQVGGSTFTKSIRVETVKPNRMSIKMNLPEDRIIGQGSTLKFDVNTRWLSGTNAPHRHATTELNLSTCRTPFKDYPDYSFMTSDHFEASNTKVFDDITDNNGNFTVSISDVEVSNAPGFLSATITTKLDEVGGDVSISSDQAYYSPYRYYVGIKLPESEDHWLKLNSDVTLSGLVLKPNGDKVSENRNIRIQIYKTEWHWWWDSYGNEDESYSYKENSTPIFDKYIKSSDGTFLTSFNISEYGRYLIVATDLDGHSSSTAAWFGSWSENPNPDASTLMVLECDKTTCNVGETFNVRFPSEKGNTAIITLEDGNSILLQKRVETGDGMTNVDFTATADMTPNVYVSVMLIQPQAVRANDRPIRLFGVQNILINNKESILKPVIKTAKEIRANDTFTLSVKEENGKPMTYTIAIVDEGLLALTSYKNPDPFSIFYAREALGIKTYDFYNYIFGAYGARLEQAFAIGGDEFLGSPEEQQDKNRFSSVVIFDGPFTLKSGETAKHTFQMPQYIGEVRTMVVAATSDGKYGSASAQTHVTKPLMVTLTAPRSFSPGDQFDIPVTLLTTDKKAKETTIHLTTDENLEIIGESQKKVSFVAGKDEQFAFFTVKAKENIGKTTLTVKAESNEYDDQKSITTEIRTPNPPVFNVESRLIKSGETAEISNKFDGFNASAYLELSTLPPLNLSQRIEELLEYPHGCAEQIVSGAFPQLLLSDLTDLSASQRGSSEIHVSSVIDRLSNYQTAEGAIALWQGSMYPNEWASVYAAHFLKCAQNRGYAVPNELSTKLISYLETEANNYRTSEHSNILQAYHLYVLTLYSKNYNSEMGRLRDFLKKYQSNDPSARYMLAAAYAASGNGKYADKTLDITDPKNITYDYFSNYYGSKTRCQSMAVIAMSSLNRQEEAYQYLSQISEDMSRNSWMSTQSMSFAMIAASTYVKTFIGDKISFPQVTLNTGNDDENIKSNSTVVQREIAIKDNMYKVKVTNHDSCNVTLQIITSHTPLNPQIQPIANGIQMSVKWSDETGNPITLSDIKQGTDIHAEIVVTNNDNLENIENLALSFIVPSGFEIINERLNGNSDAYKGADNVDIRDDRFYVYFGLNTKQSKTFRFRMNAAFAGDFILPAISCSDMYDAKTQAVVPGGRISIKANRD